MATQDTTTEDVPRSVEELQARLEEADEMLRAIRVGGVDALVVPGPCGDQVYTLAGAEHPYRSLVEAMNEGAVILTGDRTIFYSNRSFAAMVSIPLDDLIGSTMGRFVLAEDMSSYETLVDRAQQGSTKGEVRLQAKDGSVVPTHFSMTPFESGAAGSVGVVVTDLTDHHRNQKLIVSQVLEHARRIEAEADQHRIATILESITDAFFAMDREWRVTEVNQRAAGILGKTRTELVGRVFWDVYPHGRGTIIHEQCRHASTQQIPVHFEAPARTAEDSWFEMHVYPTKGEGGVAVYFRDISERKRTEELLRKANERVELILDSITDRFFAFDDEWRFTYFNKRAEEQLEILGKNPADLIGKVTWQEIPADPAVEQEFRRAQSERTVITNEHYYAPLGEWVENRIYPVTDGGLAVFQRYVTERKRAEERLQRSEACLAEGQRLSHTGSWAWNVSSGELFWSKEHFRIFGLDPEDSGLPVETARQLIHPEDRVSANQSFDRAVSERREFEQTFRIVRPDGSIRHVQSFGHPGVNESGELTEYVGTIMDITERKEEEQARKDLLRRLSSVEEDERRRISREMHDHFGQRLSALILKIAALKGDCGSDPNLGAQLASLEAIARQLDADIDFIAWQLRPTALDDLGLAAALTDYVKRWSEQFGIQAKLHVSQMELSRLRHEIDTALYRIAQEALTNIAKHAWAGHVSILVESQRGHASLVVEDDGVGFDAEQAFSAEQKRLGLIGMRERAGLLGGTLDIESRPGNGTTVVARIPLPKSPEP